MLDENAVDIRFENVEKKYDGNEKAAIDRISFSVPAGNLVVVLGPSGCGKTTLLKTVNRLIEPSGGSVYINRIEIKSIPPTELRRRIGYVIQQVGLFPHMTIRQNVTVVLDLLNWESNRIDKRVRQLLDIIGLPASYLDRYPRHLSGGEQQRIGLIRAMAADPGILLMDEPFGALDAINRDSLQEELLQIQKKLKKTILLVTHDVEEAFRLADQILIMNEGKRIQYDKPLSIISKPKNKFISELVGTNDLLRKLSLLKVSFLINHNKYRGLDRKENDQKRNHLQITELDDDLRTVLIKLLRSGNDRVHIINGMDEIIGHLTFKDLMFAASGSE